MTGNLTGVMPTPGENESSADQPTSMSPSAPVPVPQPDPVPQPVEVATMPSMIDLDDLESELNRIDATLADLDSNRDQVSRDQNSSV